MTNVYLNSTETTEKYMSAYLNTYRESPVPNLDTYRIAGGLEIHSLRNS